MASSKKTTRTPRSQSPVSAKNADGRHDKKASNNDALQTNDVVALEGCAVNDVVAAMPINALKEFEYGHDHAKAPRAGRNALAMEYLKDQYRHCKTILALGASRQLLELAGIPASKGKDPGILIAECDRAAVVAPAFIAAIAGHRHPARDSDPPAV